MLSPKHRDRRKDKDGKVRKGDDWDEKRLRDKKGRTPSKGYVGSRRSRSTSRSEESVLVKPAKKSANEMRTIIHLQYQ